MTPNESVINQYAEGYRRIRLIALPLVLAVLVSGPTATAQRPTTQPAPVDTARGGLVGDLLEQVAAAETKIIGLARAMPDAAYDWRPGPAVRSTREVLVHVAGENYYAAAKWGGRMAPQSGITGGAHAEVDAYERRPHTREQSAAALEQSFALMRAALVALPDSALDAPTEYARQTVRVRTAWVRTATHLHEHLGQLIAYARANGVRPPWSR
jgi:uncharacterized damage-inducible protein DinB